MPEETWLNDSVFIIEEFLTPDECQEYIAMSEEYGYEEATLSSAQGQVLAQNIRNNQRVIFKNEEIAEGLWERVQDFVPHEVDGRRAIGVNELFRFYKYQIGQQFNWHQDFPVELDDGSISVFTFLIYLNANFRGGETSFEDCYSEESFEAFSVAPSPGMALLFEHEIHHKGEPVLEGTKYVLRSDIFYREEMMELEDEDLTDDAW